MGKNYGTDRDPTELLRRSSLDPGEDARCADESVWRQLRKPSYLGITWCEDNIMRVSCVDALDEDKVECLWLDERIEDVTSESDPALRPPPEKDHIRGTHYVRSIAIHPLKPATEKGPRRCRMTVVFRCQMVPGVARILSISPGYFVRKFI